MKYHAYRDILIGALYGKIADEEIRTSLSRDPHSPVVLEELLRVERFLMGSSRIDRTELNLVLSNFPCLIDYIDKGLRHACGVC